MNSLATLATLATLASVGLVATTARAQRLGVSLGPVAGVNLCVLSGQINTFSSLKPGFVGGVALCFRVSPVVAIQPEIVFAQQGTGIVSGPGFFPVSAEGYTNLNYLNVPVLMKIYVRKAFNFQVGPQVGLLLSGRRVADYSYPANSGNGRVYASEDTDVAADYSSDFALCGGIGFDLANGFTSSLRLNYGLSDINNNAQDKAARNKSGIGGIYNRGYQLTVGYLFIRGKNNKI